MRISGVWACVVGLFLGCPVKAPCDAGSNCSTGGDGGDDEAGGRTVTVTRNAKWWSTRGVSVVNTLPSTTFNLYVMNGEVFTELPGTLTATAFTVPHVPLGEYAVKVGATYYVAHEDTLDLGTNQPGRGDVRLIDAGTATWELLLSGLGPSTNFDGLQFASAGAGLQTRDYGPAWLMSSEVNGTSRLLLDYGLLLNAPSQQTPAIDSTQGDVLVALQMRGIPPTDGGRVPACSSAVQAATANDVTIQPGANTTSLQFLPGEQTNTTMRLPRLIWSQRASESHTQAIMVDDFLNLEVHFPDAGRVADLVECWGGVYLNQLPGDLYEVLSVTNPFPSTWGKATYGQATYRIFKQIPDAGSWAVYATSEVWVDSSQEVVPGVHAPAQLAVQGIPADVMGAVNVREPLVVTWVPRGEPAPADYFVSLVRMKRDENFNVTRTSVASALTRNTSFTFPAASVEAGAVYFVRVLAQVHSAPERAPHSSAISSETSAISNPFVAR